MGLSEQEAPFTEPYAVAGNTRGYKSKGPTAEAVKRALAHLGFMEWKEDGNWDQHWNAEVNEAAGRWKAKRGISAASDGSWGRKAHDVMQTTWYEKGGEQLPAFDGYAQNLLQDEYAKSQEVNLGSPEKRVQDAIVDFCQKGLAHPNGWHYTQNRAVTVNVDPTGTVYSDCSGSVIQAYGWAKKKTGLNVPDPAEQNWSGYGNTSYYEDDHPKVSGQYRVGDLAHYDGHVCLCIKAGDWDSSDWWSFGSEPPSKRKLNYRSDFRYVCRPPLVAS